MSAPVVVVIESQTELGRVIRDLLVDQGYDVVRVHDPFGAIGVMRQQQVDLVVAGEQAPSQDTVTPLSGLTDEFPDTPLISLSEPREGALPFFGPWRRDGQHITLRQPFRIDDVLKATRALIA